MPPLSEYELTFSYLLGGVTRGLLVGLSVSILIYTFVPIKIENIFIVLYFSFFVIFSFVKLRNFMRYLGKKFDHMASITNFIILPLTFLSGTFYSIKRLPEIWHFIANWNPFFYMIDGFRYGFIGQSDSNIMIGISVLALTNLFFLLTLTIYIFKKGFGLKKLKMSILKVYNPADIEVDHGDGVYLYSADGTRYLDFTSGIGVMCLGHSHPALSK